ncbi:hypothetical protein BS47DRAFT_1321429 [Hydnum rufescens UP504]|uniref:histidine kinase n=1 Tax=Hydnum rufescens UP504 TaxID=1448309 RepID=A0A9P6DMQ7_9AGAM|nr:hypothetical protein BS47DRAFT_1321429 [Hydnum rufescens UP504]
MNHITSGQRTPSTDAAEIPNTLQGLDVASHSYLDASLLTTPPSHPNPCPPDHSESGKHLDSIPFMGTSSSPLVDAVPLVAFPPAGKDGSVRSLTSPTTDTNSDMSGIQGDYIEKAPNCSPSGESYAEGIFAPIRLPTLTYSDIGDKYSLPLPKRFSTPALATNPLHSPFLLQNPLTVSIERRRPIPGVRAPSSPDTITKRSISQRRAGERLVLNDEDASMAESRGPSLPTRSETSTHTSTPTRSHDPATAIADAATMRWAGANARIAPLTLSSPERELMDPLGHLVSAMSTPLAQSDTNPAHPWSSSDTEVGDLNFACAHEDGLCLGPDIVQKTEDIHNAPSPDHFSHPVGSKSTSQVPPSEDPSRGSHNIVTSEDPARTRNGHVLRSPVIQPREETRLPDLGYLTPSHEPERRKALHKYHVLQTAPDVNFDRIVHLAKLVFGVKWVSISLVGDEEQFYEQISGLDFDAVERVLSFCAHSILKQSDILVVLDTLNDSRFSNNGYARETSHLRFYAGCPLTTVDGYNIGSICILDDQPRSEFTARQRLTLKEFADLTVREMELWRDKIQLRIRDRIQTSMESFTRECLEMDGVEPHSLAPEDNMQRVYESASQLVKRTLDVEGAVVADVSNFEVLHTVSAPNQTNPTKRYHGNLFEAASHRSDLYPPRTTAPDTHENVSIVADHLHEYGRIPALPILGAAESGTPSPTRHSSLSGEDHAKLAAFLTDYPDGKMYERVVPGYFRGLVPPDIQYAMVVPIFNVDGRPFVLLCTYTTDRTEHLLEGYEMQYLRAIGVIILSAILKRRMILADKAKSLFISNISHELRTPLHGILAAAELLGDTGLSLTQNSFLQTVQACGTSLVETVNHVLDFSKLSGNTKIGAMKRTPTDLVNLLEETVEGAWVGSRARAVYGASEIGTAYSPPKRGLGVGSGGIPSSSVVETVLDVGHREEGWFLKCEKGGIRRILMNVMGNSLKFTSSGFIHVMLRELPSEPESKTLNIELAVIDSGKGISKDFLKNQLFHPFSQENPLQTGTGLGLAIVNSIVKSNGINGKVDVWSSEGVGTEIRMTIETELPSRSKTEQPEFLPPIVEKLNFARIAMLGFDPTVSGQKLLYDVLRSYLINWWDASIAETRGDANILVLNEDMSALHGLVRTRDITRPIVLLTTLRGDDGLSSVLESLDTLGGFYRVVFKPCRPSHLFAALKDCVQVLTRRSTAPPDSVASSATRLLTQRRHLMFSDEDDSREEPGQTAFGSGPRRSPFLGPRQSVPRRRSDELLPKKRPAMPVRSTTFVSNSSKQSVFTTATAASRMQVPSAPHTPPDPPGTVALADGSSLVLDSIRRSITNTPTRVLVVEDNAVNRSLLVQWLHKKELLCEEASDGQQAVDLFVANPPGYFEIILIDLQMPVLDGVAATKTIRKIERARDDSTLPPPRHAPQCVKIVALSGLASKDDKIRAFNAGVDGYLVKPVSFKMLNLLFAPPSDAQS